MLLQSSSVSPVVAAIAHAVEPWQALYSENRTVSTVVLFFHLAALVGAAGLAVANDRAIVATRLGTEEARVRKLGELSLSHRSVLTALAVSFVSGLLLLLADVEAFAVMPAFWVKMMLIAALITNALLMQRREARLKLPTPAIANSTPQRARLWAGLRGHAWTSLTLWFAIVLAGTAMT